MAGVTQNLGAADNCVGLPTAETSWRFNTFTVDCLLYTSRCV